MFNCCLLVCSGSRAASSPIGLLIPGNRKTNSVPYSLMSSWPPRFCLDCLDRVHSELPACAVAANRTASHMAKVEGGRESVTHYDIGSHVMEKRLTLDCFTCCVSVNSML